jgi:hypothetical protein
MTTMHGALERPKRNTANVNAPTRETGRRGAGPYHAAPEVPPRRGHDFGRIDVHAGGGVPAAAPAPCPFPHAAAIGRALRPREPLVGVLDPEGCAERGSPAFTCGDVSHFFSRDVGLHVAAHEAVHQLQHRGETRDAGLGPEGHADAVADSVLAGASARPLLGARGRAVPSATRGYFKADSKGDIHGARGTRSAKLSETAETLTWVSTPREAWLTDPAIDTANAVFRAKDSGISLAKTGPSMEVAEPRGQDSHTLHAVEAHFVNGPYDDCGRMAREVMGPMGMDKAAYARASPGGLQTRTPVLEKAQQSPLGHVALILDMDAAMQQAGGTDEEKRKAGDKAREEFLSDKDTDAEIRDVVKNRSQALMDANPNPKDVTQLSVADQKRMGIDRYAKPKLGEAYAIAPGQQHPGSGFPYHWAAVIYVAGSDRLVMEASPSVSPGATYDDLNTDWKFETYGTKQEKQTFHHEWKGKLGQYEHTLAMTSSPEPPSDIVTFATTPGSDLFERLDEEGRTAADRLYVRKELQRRDVVVELTVVTASHSSKTDGVALVFPPTPRRVLGRTTAKKQIAEGDTDTFRMPISEIWPLGRPLAITAWADGEWFGSNKVEAIDWHWPYKEEIGRVAGEGATYDLKLYIE